MAGSDAKKKLNAPLSNELREKYKTRTIGVRKGDTVTVFRGENKGVEGKIQRADPEAGVIYVESVTKEKADGTKIFPAVRPSNVVVRKLSLEDKLRQKTLESRSARGKGEST